MKVYNTLSGQKEDFLSPGSEVKMYVCGVTPYSDCHIGHAMSYIIFDVIRRYLELRGYRVRHVQNFTDIDDKIIDRANKLGVSARELADKYIAKYWLDMDALNIKRAHVYPYATQETPRIVEMVRGLVDKGFAYQRGGSVYFRVKSRADYGKLSHRTLDGMVAGARVEPGEEKEHPLDFALWKAAKPGEPSWESPWGAGRPGWHIECSAMSLRYLGETLDIHGGGQDLIFPHHENEIAQSESFTGVAPFVRYWLHNGLVQFGRDKMSKSLGNLVTVGEVLERHSPDAVRLFVLSSHYRSPLSYSDEGLEAAETAAERLRTALEAESTQGGTPLDAGPYRQAFMAAMDDDFNAPQALGVLFDLAREINRGREQGMEIAGARQTLRELAGVLGLSLEERKVAPPAEPLIELLISLRQELRQARQYALADRVRGSLQELGIALEDAPQGTNWKYRRPTSSFHSSPDV